MISFSTPTYFKVISKIDNKINFATLATTLHFNKERSDRHNKIVCNLGNGKYLASFVVDKQHENGNEIHTIFDNGVILVQNQKTNLVITELIARPAQIRRYWEGKSEPRYVYQLCKIAREHERNGYNNW